MSTLEVSYLGNGDSQVRGVSQRQSQLVQAFYLKTYLIALIFKIFIRMLKNSNVVFNFFFRQIFKSPELQVVSQYFETRLNETNVSIIILGVRMEQDKNEIENYKENERPQPTALCLRSFHSLICESSLLLKLFNQENSNQ